MMPPRGQVYEPRVGDFDIRLFLSLTQADGYNPLIVGTSKFSLPSEEVAMEVCTSMAVLAKRGREPPRHA